MTGKGLEAFPGKDSDARFRPSTAQAWIITKGRKKVERPEDARGGLFDR